MDFYLPFVASLLGSLHCMGMCGAIVLAYSTQRSAPPDALSGRRSILAASPMHFAYNGGRVLSYAFLGGLVGAAGAWIGSVQIAGILFSIVAGSVMVLAGLLMFGVLPGVNA